jgi:hypothetical protein
MREIGGAAGVAAVSTALASQAGLGGFHAGFVVIAVAAALGATTAWVAFERGTRTTEPPQPEVSDAPAPVIVTVIGAKHEVEQPVTR